MLDSALASGGLLDGLGINLKVVAVQIVVFSATFLVLSKMLFGRAMENIQRRESEMRKAREELARDRAEADRMLQEVEERIRRADQESYDRTQAMLKEALATAASLIAGAQADAKVEVERAREAVAAEKREALAGLKAQTSRLVLEVAEKVLDTTLDPSVHGALVSKILEERS
jgi:F-type H+-transporting ATPase subunit b